MYPKQIVPGLDLGLALIVEPGRTKDYKDGLLWRFLSFFSLLVPVTCKFHLPIPLDAEVGGILYPSNEPFSLKVSEIGVPPKSSKSDVITYHNFVLKEPCCQGVPPFSFRLNPWIWGLPFSAAKDRWVPILVGVLVEWKNTDASWPEHIVSGVHLLVTSWGSLTSKNQPSDQHAFCSSNQFNPVCVARPIKIKTKSLPSSICYSL